jgi:hypothetical protein
MAIKFTQPEETYIHRPRLVWDWGGSSAKTESTLHQLSPYIGKIKSSMAASLIGQFTAQGDVVYDPFSGSGTVALAAWLSGRRVVANDLSPYAYLLTRAKLFPYASVDDALSDFAKVSLSADAMRDTVDLRTVPRWVRQFFHPETLREIVAWSNVLNRRRASFFMACLLGILHHQRPGFLSFPSSHTVPYLRTKRFPPARFPQLYGYRSLCDRLEAKMKRALRRVPNLDFGIDRRCFCKDASRLVLSEPVDAIITSPPYMRQLDYGRDNRLRLWFLGTTDWNALDQSITPSEAQFLDLMRRCLALWRNLLSKAGYCVLVLGDAVSRLYRKPLPDAVCEIAVSEVGGFSFQLKHKDQIPAVRRVRRDCRGNLAETILVLRRR